MSKWSSRKHGSFAELVELHRLGRITTAEAEARLRRYAREFLAADGGERIDVINMELILDEVVKHPVADWATAAHFWAASILTGAPWVQFIEPATGAAS